MEKMDAASQAVARLARMPAAVQLKVLSQLAPALYQDPDQKSTEQTECETLQPGPFDWDRIMHGLATEGVVVCEHGLGVELAQQTAAALMDLELQPAKMGLSWHEESLRGDKFVWLRPDIVLPESVLARTLATIESWRETFNARAGIHMNQSKFMAACYPGGGARYVRHSVRGAKNQTRIVCFSVVIGLSHCHLWDRMFLRWCLIDGLPLLCI
jgi:hypothetical protein